MVPRNLNKTSKSEKRPRCSGAADDLAIVWKMSRDLNKLKDVKKAEEAEGVEQGRGRKLRKSGGIYIDLKLATNRTLSPSSIKSGLHCLVELRGT